MPKIQLTKSIEIDAPVDKVYEKISDLHHWKSWSPWIIQEPNCKLTIAEDGKSQEWEGKRIGSGNMSISSENGTDNIHTQINFIKPFKSKAKAYFDLKASGDKTVVSWTMDSSLPFFMFMMKKMMITYIGMDYDRGLKLLKEYVEDGEAHSKLDFVGKSKYPGAKFVGIKKRVPFSKVGVSMNDCFTKAWEVMDNHQDLLEGKAFSQYHKMNMVKDDIEFTAGFFVKEVPADLPADFVVGEIPTTEVFTIKHTGPYENLGNPWSTLYAMKRAKEFKQDKSVDPFEIYVNDPSQTPKNELVTEISFAVK